MRIRQIITALILFIALSTAACQTAEVHDLLYDRPTDYERIEERLASGSSPNAMNHEGLTLLWRAASRGDVRLVQMLLEYGADPKYQLPVRLGETALHVAAGQGEDEIVEILLDEGVPVDVASWGGITPLHRAAKHKQASTVRLLIGQGADPRQRAEDGMGVLDGIGMSGNAEGYLEVVKALVEAGAPPDEEAALGRTPLFDACYAGNEDVVTYLLSKGADPNHQDNSGFSPLMMTSLRRELGCSTLLLDAGADPAIMDESGRTALDIAKELGNNDIIDLLKSFVD